MQQVFAKKMQISTNIFPKVQMANWDKQNLGIWRNHPILLMDLQTKWSNTEQIKNFINKYYISLEFQIKTKTFFSCQIYS